MSNYMRFTRVKKIEHVARLKNSKNGNPRFKFIFADGDMLTTQTDAGWVYSISPDQLIGRPVAATFHFTPTGRGILDGLATCQPWQDAAVHGSAA
jgi:hypothetical protein